MIALTGEICHFLSVEDLYTHCLTYIPENHIPELIILKDKESSFQHGLIAITLDRLRINPLLDD